MKNFLILLCLSSLQAFAGPDINCRMAIHNLDKLMGTNSVLIDKVNSRFEEKQLTLIGEDELTEGDYLIPNLIAVYNRVPKVPMHEYQFSTKRNVVLVPCLALPLCSPIVVEKQVTDIVGIKYKQPFTINLITSSGSETLLESMFKHSFNEIPVSWSQSIPYDGSAEQEDLALAIAKKLPKCSKLRSKKNVQLSN